MADTAMPIGELSRRTGCNIETIRYYERIGLLPAPPRRGRYRSYGPPDVSRLRFVRRGRELGFSLDEIRALLELAAPQRRACDEVRVIAAAHLADVRAKLADLKRLEAVLADTVAQCRGRSAAPSCPVLDVLERL
jgi:MerR family mercuric resistance operon transcriptional regulator